MGFGMPMAIDSGGIALLYSLIGKADRCGRIFMDERGGYGEYLNLLHCQTGPETQ